MSIKQGEYLKKLRIEHKLSQEQLSEILGISRQSVSKWEQGNSTPDIYNLTKLSEYYGISVDSLVKGEPDITEKDDDVSALIKPNEENSTREGNESVAFENIKVDEKFEKETNKAEVNDNKNSEKKEKHHHSWLYPAYPVLSVIAYCVIGAIFGGKGWALGWLVILTIPLFYTGVSAVRRKKPIIFCYPVLVVMVYLFLGLGLSLWHPYWIIFLTIPLFYIITAKMQKK